VHKVKKLSARYICRPQHATAKHLFFQLLVDSDSCIFRVQSSSPRKVDVQEDDVVAAVPAELTADALKRCLVLLGHRLEEKTAPAIGCFDHRFDRKYFVRAAGFWAL
jgi:hypothetical protein